MALASILVACQRTELPKHTASYRQSLKLVVIGAVAGVQLAERLLSSQRLMEKLANHVVYLHLDPVEPTAAVPLCVQLWPICSLASLQTLELGVSMPAEDWTYSLPADMSKLTSLAYLEVTKAEDSEQDGEISLPSELCIMKQLTRMSFCMTIVPDGAWSQSRWLLHLKAEEVLFMLPTQPGSFSQLQQLEINCATVLGPVEALAGMTKLLHLSLTDVQPQDKEPLPCKLGAVVGGLTSLISLTLIRCELSPATVFDLHLLNRLEELRMCELLHDAQGFRLPSHPSKLLTLHLTEMSLEAFECSDMLTALQTLILADNSLTEVPSGLPKLQSLRRLVLERQALDFQLHDAADFTVMPQLDCVLLCQCRDHQWSVDSLIALAESDARLRRALPKAHMLY